MSEEDEECIHGIWPSSACSICNGNDRRSKELAEEDWRTFPAKYDGTCAGCDRPIQEGDLIAWRPDSPIYHEECAP